MNVPTPHPNVKADELDSSVGCPYRNLLAAMLQRAICDAINETHVEDHVRREAKAWLRFGRKIRNPKRLSSFEWVCHHLDLSPYTVRAVVMQYSRDWREWPS